MRLVLAQYLNTPSALLLSLGRTSLGSQEVKWDRHIIQHPHLNASCFKHVKSFQLWVQIAQYLPKRWKAMGA